VPAATSSRLLRQVFKTASRRPSRPTWIPGRAATLAIFEQRHLQLVIRLDVVGHSLAPRLPTVPATS